MQIDISVFPPEIIEFPVVLLDLSTGAIVAGI
jgi:hypothetical protein